MEECNITCELRLWIVEFTVLGYGKGCAVIKAKGADSAREILEHSGMYNGKPSLYKISRIEEIVESPCSDLICEQIISYKNDYTL